MAEIVILGPSKNLDQPLVIGLACGAQGFQVGVEFLVEPVARRGLVQDPCEPKSIRHHDMAQRGVQGAEERRRDLWYSSAGNDAQAASRR